MKAVMILLGVAALACAPAPHAGDQIAIVEESALIVWDPAAHMQHFIRRATFHGKGRDFGFLVPTPSAPELAEVSEGIFDALEDRTQRDVVRTTRKVIDWTPLVLAIFVREGARMPSGAPPPVEVLSTQKVAGYEAAVLAATDAAALRQWLSDHGYAASNDLTEWLDAYVRRNWKITAFKIDATQPAARTGAVKMSFVTDRPFFPYREPASQRQLDFNTSRALRIWFLGPERVRGVVGENTSWPALLRRSDPLPNELRDRVARDAKVALPASVRMTAFIDQSSVRPGFDDLFFLRDADQRPFVEPPVVVTEIHKTRVPLDVVLLAAIAIILGIRRAG